MQKLHKNEVHVGPTYVLTLRTYIRALSFYVG